MKKSVLKKTILVAVSLTFFLINRSFAQLAPELVFRNPTLVSGTALTEGAVYKFPDVMTGVDAHVKLKKFSRKEIVMATIDNNTYGWDKAFQPEFGLAGVVQPFQNWYIDFEMKFYKAGTTSKYTINKIIATALDVDGDNVSISEYYLMKEPDSISFAPVSYLQSIRTPNPVCGECGKESVLKTCTNCNGTGNKNYSDPKKKWEADQNCRGTGKLHTECGHAFYNLWNYEMTSTIQNFVGIDTLGTQVMATYFYMQEDDINFRIGAMSGTAVSNGAGIRLNSLWFKNFSLAPLVILPIKLTSFTALRKEQNVMLTWTTSGDGSISRFVVERSTDGVNFLQAGVVEAGAEVTNGTYSFKDATSTSGTGAIYYRICMVDADQQSSYSTIAVVRQTRSDGNNVSISAYPNPAQDQLKVAVPNMWQGQALNIEIYNSNGVRLQSKQCPKAASIETVQINHLSKGIYIVKAGTKTSTAQQTVYKN